MIGNRVRVVRQDAEPFDGVLLKSDDTGVIVHKRDGFNDKRLFIPHSRIIEIEDRGRTP